MRNRPLSTRRWRPLRAASLALALTIGGLAALGLSPAAPAGASSVSVSCTAGTLGTSGVLDIGVSGSPAPSVGLTVATAGGDYVVTLDDGTTSTPVCTGQSLPDSGSSGFPQVEVTGPAPVPTTFEPGTASGVTFTGESSAPNTLDLSGESSTSFTGLTVAMPSSASCPNGGQLTGTGNTAIDDCFSNVGTVVGSASVSTTFEPDPAVTATPSAVPLFVGGTGTVGNVLDLSSVASPDASGLTVGGPTVSMGADTAAGPGTVTAEVGTNTVTFANFYGVNEVQGSSTLGTDFQPGTASPEVTFVGAPGPTNTLDLTSESSANFTRLTVSMPGASSTCSGTGALTGTGFASIGDCFSNVGNVLGSSSVSTTFQPSSGGTARFVGQSGSDTLDLSHAPSSVTLNLGLSGPQVTGGAGTLTLVPGTISTVIGAPNNDTFLGGPGNLTLIGGEGTDWLQAGSGTDVLIAGSGPTTLVGGTGYDTMTGGAGADRFIPGTGGGKITDTAGVGTLDYSKSSAPVDVNASTSPYTTPSGVDVPPETATGGGGAPEALVGIAQFVGSASGGTTFLAPATAGLTFEGQGPGNTLDLPTAPRGIMVKPNGDSPSSPGSVSGLIGGTDTFSGFQTFVGSAQGGTTFLAPATAGLTFEGQGPGNTLDLPTAPRGIMVKPNGDSPSSPGSVSGLIGGTDTFSGFQTFVGGPRGMTSFVPSATGGLAFHGEGPSNVLDLSSVPARATLVVNGDTLTSPGIIGHLSASGGAPSSDPFSGIQSFVGYSGTAFTSANVATVIAGRPFSLRVTTTGSPTPKLSEEGRLPTGVKFLDLSTGTARLYGTPTSAGGTPAVGTFRFVITASFGIGKGRKVLTQRFTLTVSRGSPGSPG